VSGGMATFLKFLFYLEEIARTAPICRYSVRHLVHFPRARHTASRTREHRANPFRPIMLLCGLLRRSKASMGASIRE
jgi:hypothetical protein